MTNNTLLSDITVMPTIHSDHNLIKMSTDLQLREPVYREHNMPFSNINLHKAEWNKVNNMLSDVKWEEELKNLGTEQCWDKIAQNLNEALYMYSPRKMSIRKRKHVTKEHRQRKILMRRRTKVEKLLANNSNNNRARKEILELEKAIKASHEIENRDIEKTAIDSIKSNSKAFFSYAKRKAVIRNSIGPLTTADGASTSDPQVMADTLQDQFIRGGGGGEKRREDKQGGEGGTRRTRRRRMWMR